MSLFIEGDRNKIKQYRDRAELDGLEIILYSEKTGIGEVKFSSKPALKGDIKLASDTKIANYSSATLKILYYLQQQSESGRVYVKQKELTTKLKIKQPIVSLNMKMLEKDHIVRRARLSSNTSLSVRLLRKLSDNDYKTLKSKLLPDSN